MQLFLLDVLFFDGDVVVAVLALVFVGEADGWWNELDILLETNSAFTMHQFVFYQPRRRASRS